MIDKDRDLTKDEILILHQITIKAMKVLTRMGASTNMLDLELDIEHTHREHPLDLDKLLAFSEKDFMHDVVGIYCNFDRPTKSMQNLFTPRSAQT